MTYPEVQAFETFFKSLMDHLHARLSDACPEFAVLQLADFLPFIPFSSFWFTKRRDQITFMNLDFYSGLKSFRRGDFLTIFFKNIFLGSVHTKTSPPPPKQKPQSKTINQSSIQTKNKKPFSYASTLGTKFFGYQILKID